MKIGVAGGMPLACRWALSRLNAAAAVRFFLPSSFAFPLLLVIRVLVYGRARLISTLYQTDFLKATNKAMEAYDFSIAASSVYSFWQYELCDVYIEVMKPVMATANDLSREAAAARRATQAVLW